MPSERLSYVTIFPVMFEILFMLFLVLLINNHFFVCSGNTNIKNFPTNIFLNTHTKKKRKIKLFITLSMLFKIDTVYKITHDPNILFHLQEWDFRSYLFFRIIKKRFWRTRV